MVREFRRDYAGLLRALHLLRRSLWLDGVVPAQARTTLTGEFKTAPDMDS